MPSFSVDGAINSLELTARVTVNDVKINISFKVDGEKDRVDARHHHGVQPPDATCSALARAVFNGGLQGGGDEVTLHIKVKEILGAALSKVLGNKIHLILKPPPPPPPPVPANGCAIGTPPVAIASWPI